MATAKILIVDDEFEIRRMLQEMLESESYDVDVAGSATEALAFARRAHYDLLITDICLPNIDGLELSRRLRESNPDIISILVTGYPTIDTTMKGIKAGVSDYLTKPVRKAKLCQSVAVALKRQEHLRFLERMAQESKRGESDRGQFVNVLAHELRTSLTPMLTGAELLLEKLKGEPETVEDRLARLVFGSAQLMRYRLDKLLLLARLEAGTLKLHLDDITPTTFLESITSRFEAVAAEKNQRLVLNLQHGMSDFKADRTCLEQVITNLVENALKFTPDSGTVTIGVENKKNEVIISVRDGGTPLAEEERSRLLEPFWKSEVDRYKIPGVRLSFALCQKLIEILGGRIWIESCTEKGNDFKFAVPI